MPDLNRVREAYGASRYAEVISAYEAVTDATDPEWHLYGCMALEKVGRVREARWAVERAVGLGPGGELAVRTRWMRGYLSRHLGDCYQALQDFAFCLAEVYRYPDLEERLAGALQYNRGLALMPYGRKAEAMSVPAEVYMVAHGAAESGVGGC